MVYTGRWSTEGGGERKKNDMNVNWCIIRTMDFYDNMLLDIY